MATKFSKVFKEALEKITYRHWIMLAGAASVLLGVLVFFSLSGREAAREAEPVNMVHVVVAKQDIAPKTIIKEAMLEVREMPAHLVPADAASSVMDVVNKPARVQIMKDDVISGRKVLSDMAMAGFTGSIPPSCRAVSIAISDITGVAGFAQPGDYVDVIIIAKNDNKMMGRVVLQDVQLLAINKTPEQPASPAPANAAAAAGDTSKVGTAENDAANQENTAVAPKAMDNLATATLALTPEDALKLITEAQEGTVYLTLRPYKPRDRFTVNTTHVHYSALQSAKGSSGAPKTAAAPVPARAAAPAPAPSAAPAAPAVSAPRSGGVEVIRGTSVSREGF
ncbi:MAG: Flp pilus assembly protein CpaB [Anaerovibrio sp.]